MSKLKVSGNASGTGVITLEAPNTNTDRAITLPDSAGTLLMTDGDGSNLTGLSHTPEGTAVLSTGETGATKFLREDGDGTCSWQAAAGGVDGIVSSADATAITIDSSENVGIGTTSPNRKLTVIKNSASDTPVAKVENSNTSGWLVGLESLAPNLGTGSYYAGVVVGHEWSGNNAGKLEFYYAGDASTSNSIGLGWHGKQDALKVKFDNTVSVDGSFSKGSGSFKIKHPLESKKDTHYLMHSFVESPRTDLIYRGKTQLTNGQASINIDTYFGMAEGTFDALTDDVDTFTSNESGWDSVKGSVIGNILTIDCQSNSCSDTISWMVVADRKDEHIMTTPWTDDDGKPILEPLIPEDEKENLENN
jgi:hypothetical protein